MALGNYDGSIKIDTKLDTGNIEKGLNSLGQTVKKGFAAIGIGVAAGLGAATKAGMDFEAQMSKVEAISGASAEDMGLLTEKAKQMGIDTKFSATEAGQALEYMAMAGWKTEDMLNGIDGIMNLAAASGENLGQVSDIVTDALTAFGLEAKDSAHFADVLAKASNDSNTDVAMMGQTFKYVGSVAGAMKFSIEDTSVAIGLMANAGIKAEQAGTSLRAVFTRLAKPPKEAADAIKELGLQITETDGSFKSLGDIMVDMRSKFSQLTDVQKTQYAAMLGGQEAMSGLLAIINASDDDFNKLTKSINDADGSAKEMAETMNDNLKGQLTLLKSSLEGLGLAVYDGISAPMKEAVKASTESINGITESFQNGELQGALTSVGNLFGGLVTAVTNIAAVALPPLTTALSFVANNLGLIVPLVSGVVVGMKTYTAITTAASVAQGALNAVMKANPFGLVIAALGGLATAIGIITSECKNAEDSYYKMGASIEEAGNKLEEVKEKSKLSSEYLNEWDSLNKTINDAKTPANELARAEERRKEVESWIIENYGNFISAEEEKNGIRQETVNLLKEKLDLESKSAQLELQKEVTEKAGEIPDLIENIALLKERNQALTDQKNEILETSIKLSELKLEWDKFMESNPNEAEKAQYLSEFSEKVNELTGRDVSHSGLSGLIAITNEYDSQLAILNGEISENISKIDEGTKSISQYEAGARQLIELNLGQTYLEACTSLALMNRAQEELNTTGSITTKTFDELINKFPELEGCKTSPDILRDAISELESKMKDAEAQAEILGTTLDGTAKTSLPDEIKKAGQATKSELENQVIVAAENYAKILEEIESGNDSVTEEQKNTALEQYNLAVSEYRKIGMAIPNGVAEGIAENDYVAINAAAKLMTDSLAASRKAIDSHSPSKKFRDKVGVTIPEGIAVGIKNKASVVYEELETLNNGMLASEEKYLSEKERIDKEREQREEAERQKEYEKRLNNAKDAAEAEEIKQEEILRKQEIADDKYLEELKSKFEEEKQLLEEQKNAIVSAYTEIAQAAKAELSEIEQAQSKLADKLKGYGSLYTEWTTTIKGGGEHGEDLVFSKYRLNDLSKDIEALEAYKEALLAVKERGAPDGFFEILQDMEIDEGTKFANTLLGLSDAEFQKYINDWNRKNEVADSISKEFYKDKTDETLQQIENELEAWYGTIPEGFLTEGKLSAEKFGEGFMEQLESVFKELEDAVSMNVSRISPTIAIGTAAAGGGNTVYNSTTQTFTIGTTKNTTSEQISQWENATEIARLRGQTQ